MPLFVSSSGAHHLPVPATSLIRVRDSNVVRSAANDHRKNSVRLQMENGKKENDEDLDKLFAMMAVDEPPEPRIARATQSAVAEVRAASGIQPPTFRSQQYIFD